MNPRLRAWRAWERQRFTLPHSERGQRVRPPALAPPPASCDTGAGWSRDAPWNDWHCGEGEVQREREGLTQPRIFVSHSAVDRDFTTRLVKDLRQAGAEVWTDADLGAGPYPEQIGKELGKCDWFLLVLTRDALESKWVRDEVQTALALMNSKDPTHLRDLIPFKAGAIETGDIPEYLRAYEVFDATLDYASAFNRVLRQVTTPHG
jgi:TIR domain-containing protein